MLHQSASHCLLDLTAGDRLPLIAKVLRRQWTATRCIDDRNSSNLSMRMHMVVASGKPMQSFKVCRNNRIPLQQHEVSVGVRCHYHRSCHIRKDPLSTSAATANTFPEYSCPSVIITQQAQRPKLTTAPIQTLYAPHTASTSTIATTDMTVPLSESLASSLHQQQQTMNAASHVTQAASSKTASVLHNHDNIKMSDLRALFIASSIPMIGFGFMDQFVLIQAGGYIDATFGISFGLATLSAAAAGQVVSDVSGVVFGGALERFLTTNTSWLRTPNITQLQRQLPICRNVSMLGAIVGVIIGCAIGATSLLFVDLEARNRMERAQRLREIVQDMITAARPASSTSSEVTNHESTASDQVFSCDSCTVYVVSTKDLTLPTDHSSNDWKVNLKDISSTVTTSRTTSNDTSSSNYDDNDEMQSVQRCIASRSIVLSEDRRVMFAPLLKRVGNKDGKNTPSEIMAVVVFRYATDLNDNSSNNLIDETNTGSNSMSGGYSDEDVITARVMARHIAIFMDR
jgi:Transmembrane protein 65